MNVVNNNNFIPALGYKFLTNFYDLVIKTFLHKNFREPLLKHSTVQRRILDFGCGDGAFLLQAAQSMGTRPLWGFEIAEKRSIQELCGGVVRVVRGEFRDLLEVLFDRGCGNVSATR